jgi:hypothetical protein
LRKIINTFYLRITIRIALLSLISSYNSACGSADFNSKITPNSGEIMTDLSYAGPEIKEDIKLTPETTKSKSTDNKTGLETYPVRSRAGRTAPRA